MREIRLGSLFDGVGGFPLAGAIHGVRPVWASEIEPFPIRVTKARFPQMKHLGSVTDVDGTKTEPVDIITFGSPCQDLSVAGKQAGIHEGQRSSLFFEAIRIIKEMRNGTADKFPRFAVWENVPGAFSSNKGEDFRAVIQAICEIRGGRNLIVPMPPKRKWLPAGCVVGDGWSVAWRVYDAQYWGVPQRRKRIYLIADFGSERAGEILFESESLSGHSEQGQEAGEGTAADAEGSAGRSHLAFGWANSGNAGLSEAETSPTVKASRNGDPGVCYSMNGNTGGGADRNDISARVFNESGKGYWMPGVGTIRAEGENRPSRPGHVAVEGAPVGVDLYNGQITGDKSATLNANSGASANHAGPSVVYPINTMAALRGGKDDGRQCFGVGEENDPQFTISAAHEHAVCYAME